MLILIYVQLQHYWIFFSIRGSAMSLLFCHQDDTPLTKYQFWSVTTMALRVLGWSGVRSGMHFFRIGAASTATAMGYSMDRIKQLGQWQLAVYKSHVHPVTL